MYADDTLAPASPCSPGWPASPPGPYEILVRIITSNTLCTYKHT